MRFISPLDDQAQAALKHVMKTHTVHQVRQRAHAILLSAKGYKVKQLADIFEVDRDAITEWFDRWERDGVDGLENKPRSGRPPSLSSEEEDRLLEAVQAEPRQLKTAALDIVTQVSLYTLKRVLKRHRYRWRRLRTSLRHKRDEAAFREAEKALNTLKEQEDAGLIDLVYFDESGFSLQPVVPYGWQAPRRQILLPSSSHHRRINVLGFLQRNNRFNPYIAEDRVNGETVIACIDAFARHLRKPTVLVIDNAPIHKGKAFEEAKARWQQQGLRLFFLPSYSPELNLIERLWQEIKYRWLPLRAYESWTALQQCLTEVLVGIGQKYRISFA